MSRRRADPPKAPVSRQVRRREERQPKDRPSPATTPGVRPLKPALAREARLVAVVIAAAAVAWIGAQWLGGRLGWDTRYVFLFDLAALAAFVWALVVTWRIWRRRQEE